ncbi:unnamed protein product [Nesidiocoris tenuis]|uniref:Uncharacterized protein n=1 Tax=Nesidiocoris tenuis TaxID=355587 RepID=A0A6H5GAP5_9HEMI|nr:unnamed protein product [Nesidiocoris tenuis]
MKNTCLYSFPATLPLIFDLKIYSRAQDTRALGARRTPTFLRPLLQFGRIGVRKWHLLKF